MFTELIWGRFYFARFNYLFTCPPLFRAVATQNNLRIGPASLAHENEAGGSWGQEVHILHVNI